MSIRQSPSQSQHASTGRPVTADVHATPKAGGGVAFALKWRFEGDSGDQDGPIDIPAKKHGDPGTDIHFHLRDSSGRKLRFDPDDPIWVSRDTCPPQSSSDSEIPTEQVKANPNLLKVHNLNQDQCDLKYALLFRDSNGKLEPFDPMIRNGGTH